MIEKIVGRINLMETVTNKQYEPKINHSLKILGGLSRKIVDLDKVYDKIDKQYEEKQFEKSSELDACKKEIENLTQQEAEARQKFDDISAETSLENEKNEKLKSVINNGQTIVDKIGSETAALAQLTSDVEVQLEALQNLLQVNDTVQKELDEICNNVDQAHEDLEMVKNQQETLLKRHENISYLVKPCV